MYNSDMPTRAELPGSKQLIRSTLIAFFTALALLVTIILPAEYAIDPTGVGRMLGLTDMGEIKQQLEAEARLDAQLSAIGFHHIDMILANHLLGHIILFAELMHVRLILTPVGF